jgi:transglutaminase-like putative cysteine protease
MAAVCLPAFLFTAPGWSQTPTLIKAQFQANQSDEAPNQRPVTIGIDAAITVHADLTAEVTETRRIRIFSEAAIKAVSKQSLDYIEGMQTLDIQGYTEKLDGRRIPLDPKNIITAPASTGSPTVSMPDAKIRTATFSDVAVGDTLVLISRRVHLRSMYAGQFTTTVMFPLNLPAADSKIVISAPKQLTLNVGTYGEHLEDHVTSDGTTTQHVVVYHPQRQIAPEAGATSLLDRDPRVVITTFQSYEQLGLAFRAAFEPKLQPTPEIIALANQITSGITDRRLQAEAIDRWIKQNISYAAIYVGTDRVIANDPAEVLKHRYGDCKDHATLMAALLAVKGITGELVLINQGDVFTLPQVVAPSYFNHMIVYLPEFHTYDDPTTATASFGVLARTSYDKPVLHFSQQGARLARTPAMQAAEHVTVSHTRIAIAADGTVTGETRDTATGANAVEVREAALKLRTIGLETGAERVLQYLKNPGKGRLEIGSPLDGARSYTMGGKFTLSGRIDVTPGAALGIPRGLDVLSPGRPGEVLLGTRLPHRQLPFSCWAGRQIEDIEVSFAAGLPLPSLPTGVRIDRPLFSYKSEYRIESRTLKIRREFESRVTGEVCAPQIEAEIAVPMKAVQADLATRMVIPKLVASATPSRSIGLADMSAEPAAQPASNPVRSMPAGSASLVSQQPRKPAERPV